MSQIKSRERVIDLAEVLTHDREVDNILDRIEKQAPLLVEDIACTFLEPSCGTGNFLVNILSRKLSSLDGLGVNSDNVLCGLSSIYGIDIDGSNVATSRLRLLDTVKDFVESHNVVVDDIFWSQVNVILDANIICADALNHFDDITWKRFAWVNGVFTVENVSYGIDGFRFNMIVGNPPYQSRDNNTGRSSAVALYNLFVKQAIGLSPDIISMIIPSRWFVTGKNLDKFRASMLSDRRLAVIVDYVNARECFPDVEIKGGVCYFVWDASYDGLCEVSNVVDGVITNTSMRVLNESDIFIRDSSSASVVFRVLNMNNEFMDSRVFSRAPFGIMGTFKNFTTVGDFYCYGWKVSGFVRTDDVKKNLDTVKLFKVFTSKAASGGSNIPNRVMGRSFVAAPDECCTDTFLMVDVFKTKTEAENLVAYMRTKFFRFLVFQRKITQNSTSNTFAFVPVMDMNFLWTDELLYEYFDLSADDVSLIESTVQSFEV